MKIKNAEDVESKILAAAKEVFVKKGFSAATMSDIAETAKISRTSLNYYFRNKEKLFDAICGEIFENLIPQIDEILEKKCSFEKKLEMIINVHCEVLLANSDMPAFIVGYMNALPQKFYSFVGRILGKQKTFIKLVSEIRREYSLNHSQMLQLFSMYAGMMIMPFLQKDLLSIMGCGNFENFVRSRKLAILAMLKVFLKKI